MDGARLTWRDRVLLANSVLFCVVGAVLIVRFCMGQVPLVGVILGVAAMGLGAYRLWLARREVRKRAAGPVGR